MAKLRFGTKKVARTWEAGPSATFFAPAPLGHGPAPPPPPSHGQISNRKRPLNFRKHHLGWGGVG